MKAPIFDFLIIAGGAPPENGFLRSVKLKSKFLVTVDHGAHVAKKMKWKQDLHVGDNDSTSPQVYGGIENDRILLLPRNKSFSDLEFVLRILPPASVKLVVAAHRDTEGRTDHVFINLLLASQFKNLFLADETMWIRRVKKESVSFSCAKATNFSIVAGNYGSGRTRVSVSGADFPLKNARLSNLSMGLSNRTASHWTKVSTLGSALLLVSSNLSKTPLKFSHFG